LAADHFWHTNSFSVAQYEDLTKKGFLHEYIQQLNTDGYHGAAFEFEASANAIDACQDAAIPM
jgi:hypothetical protein